MVPCKDGFIEQRSTTVYHNVIQNVTLLFGLCLYTAVIYSSNMQGRDAIHSVPLLLFDCACIFIASMYAPIYLF